MAVFQRNYLVVHAFLAALSHRSPANGVLRVLVCVPRLRLRLCAPAATLQREL